MPRRQEGPAQVRAGGPDLEAVRRAELAEQRGEAVAASVLGTVAALMGAAVFIVGL
jgi:hypothetical protein